MGFDQVKGILKHLLPISYVLIFTFPALPNALQSFVFSFFFISVIIDKFLKEKKLTFSRNIIFTWLALTLYYIIYLLSFLHEPRGNYSLDSIQPSILLLIGPTILVFFDFRISESSRRLATLILTLSNYILIGLLLYHWSEGVRLAYKLYSQKIDFGNYLEVHIIQYILTNSNEFINSLTAWAYYQAKPDLELNTHHAYLAAVMNLNILLLIQSLNFRNQLFKGIINLISIILLMLFVIYLDSKVNTFLLIIVIFWLTLYYTSTSKFKNYFYTLAIILIVGMGFFHQDKIEAKFKAIYTSEISRAKLYKNVLPIVKNNLFFGIGVNNVNHLVEKVMKKDTSAYSYHFNDYTVLKSTHSQFLHYQLATGIINTLAFILMFSFLFYLFYSTKYRLGLLMILIILLNCFFEDFLNRAWGVYTFLAVLLLNWKFNTKAISANG